MDTLTFGPFVPRLRINHLCTEFRRDRRRLLMLAELCFAVSEHLTMAEEHHPSCKVLASLLLDLPIRLAVQIHSICMNDYPTI